MGWPAGCSLEWQEPSSIAKQAWEGCGVGGCSKLKVDYVYDDFEPFTSANVGSNAAARLRLLFIRRKSPKFESWYLTLRDDGTPVQLLRSFDCAPFLALGPTSVCAVLGNLAAPSGQAARFQSGTPPAPLLETFATQGIASVACTSELFVSHDDFGTETVRDLATTSEYLVTPPNGVAYDLRVHGGYALFVRSGVEDGGPVLDGWLWKRPNELVKLVDPGTQKVFDIRTDGTTLVWTQVNAADSKEVAAGDLWTSPFGTTASALTPKKRRSVPPSTVGLGNYAIGGGHYALVEGALSTTQTKLHVYRLSDARHWEVQPPPGLVNSTVLYVDEKEVWYLARLPNGLNQTIARQKIDALGPGD